MRHPFDGIDIPQTRRSWLGFLTALTGWLGFRSVASAAAPPGARVKVMPEPSPEPAPPMTTALRESGATTKAVGEEGGQATRALNEGGISTRALGEEGGIRPSTRAVGEEGGAVTRALREAGKVPPPIATTLAVGEEGGKKKVD